MRWEQRAMARWNARHGFVAPCSWMDHLDMARLDTGCRCRGHATSKRRRTPLTPPAWHARLEEAAWERSEFDEPRIHARLARARRAPRMSHGGTVKGWRWDIQGQGRGYRTVVEAPLRPGEGWRDQRRFVGEAVTWRVAFRRLRGLLTQIRDGASAERLFGTVLEETAEQVKDKLRRLQVLDYPTTPLPLP